MERKYTNESAIAAVRAAGAEPLEPYPGDMVKKWACRCTTCGTTVYPRMGSIDRGSKACRVCHGPNAVDPDLAFQAMLTAGVQPLEPYPGYDRHWKVRCIQCGHESTPMYRSIAKGQGACFRCGTDYGDLPAHVYLVHDPARRVVKVGITNAHANRMKDYEGWSVLELILLGTGREAAQIEAEVLRCWRFELGLPPKLTREEMSSKGYTETADDAGLEAALSILCKYRRSEPNA